MPFTFYAICDDVGVVNLGETGQKAVFSSREAAERVLALAKQKGFQGFIQPVHLEIAGSEDD